MGKWWMPAFFGGNHDIPPTLGPYECGMTDVMVGDSKDDGVFVRLYYPSDLPPTEDKDSPRAWTDWLPCWEYLEGFAHITRIYYWIFRIFYMFFAGKPKIPGIMDVPLSSQLKKFKTIVFSHGLGGTRFFYTSICTELAANGYLVAAVEHRDESASMTWFYSGGERKERRWLKYRHVKLGGSEHATTRSQQVDQRSREAVRALHLLQDLNAGKDIQNSIDNKFDLTSLKNRLDVTAPIMMGHSFGGATTLLTLSRTPEFKTGVVLDPWLFPLKNHQVAEQIKQPLLTINTKTFQTVPNIKELRKYTSGEQPGPRENYTLKQTTHENQCDTVFIIGYWLNTLSLKRDPVDVTRINNGIIFKFLRDYANYDGPATLEKFVTENEACIHKDIIVDGTFNFPMKIPDKWCCF